MKKVLIINPFGIGDVILSLQVAEALQSAYPGISIGFLCNERTWGLVRLAGSVERYHIFNRDLFRRLQKKSPFLMLKKLSSLLSEIGRERYEATVDLSLGREYPFFSAVAGIRKRIGLDHKGRGLFLTHKRTLRGYETISAARTQLELLRYFGIEPKDRPYESSIKPSAPAEAAAANYLERNGFLDGLPIVAVSPGGGRSWGPNARYKQWEPEHFAAAVNLFSRNHPCRAILFGDREEEGLLREAALRLKVPHLLSLQEPIERVAALLARARLWVGNDGGLAHLSAAMRTRTVVLFGPVDERVYAPYAEASRVTVVTQPVPCRPCYREFRFPPCEYDRRCLTELSVASVVSAMESAVKKS